MRMFMSASFLALLSSLASGAVIGEWDFNLYDGDAHRIKASTGQGVVILGEEWTEKALSNPKGSAMNAGNDRDAGQCLGLTGQGANGQFLEIKLPTSGAGPLEMDLAMRRSGTGYTTVNVFASHNGGDTFRKITSWSPVEKWAKYEARLDSGSGSDLVLRLVVDGATSSRGGIRLDNLVIQTAAGSAPQSE
ncbi:MAG: hypothetical protein MK089_12375 [Phycisphaerales bacterium]|nr:hypothetical protein [Phycisphaerales bacterium]